MKAFPISIHSFDQVRAFVRLAMVQPFDVLVGNEHQRVNGKNLMGMSSLDFHGQLQVLVNCDEDSYQKFRQKTIELFAS